jgi:hypothetical protein
MVDGGQDDGSTYAWYNITDDTWLGSQPPAYTGELLQQTITTAHSVDIALYVLPPEGLQTFKPFAQVVNARAIIQAIGTP